jgi:hypothetical protein
MPHDVCERNFMFSGDAGTGVSIGGPAARFDVGLCAGASRADMTVGIGTKTPCGWFEVRNGGKVGVKVVDLP